jgi:hypothetical protein
MPYYDEGSDEESDDGPRRPKVLDVNGDPMCFVAAYSVERNYGGPEEGGWWYDSGNLVDVRGCSQAELPAVLEDMQAKYPRTGNRYNVAGGEDHSIEVWDDGEMPVDHYPVDAPHYC